MNTSQPTAETPTLRRALGRIAGQLMALGVRFPAAAGDLAVLLDITEAIIDEQPIAAELGRPHGHGLDDSNSTVVVRFPERAR